MMQIINAQSFWGLTALAPNKDIETWSIVKWANNELEPGR